MQAISSDCAHGIEIKQILQIILPRVFINEHHSENDEDEGLGDGTGKDDLFIPKG